MKIENTSGVIPKGRAVLLKPYMVEEKTAGGIVLPTQVQQKDQLAEQRAVVVAIGPTAWSGEPEPRAMIGDRILFSKWAGYQFNSTYDGEVYRVVNDSDIFRVIVKEKGDE